MSNSENESLELIVSAHLSDLLRFATRLTGNPDAAEEVVGEAMVRIVRSWKSFRCESQAATWLKRIVINAFRDWIAEQTVAGADRCGYSRPERFESRRLCPHRRIGSVDCGSRFRLAATAAGSMVLVGYEGLSIEEAAKLLDIRASNVHATLHAARQSLRRSLASYLREESHER